MKAHKYFAAAGLATVCVTGSVVAAELSGAEIQALISGKTGYAEPTSASVSGVTGQAVIYWAPDGSSFFKTPKGDVLHGTWAVKGNFYCSGYKEAPKRPCMKFDRQGDVVNMIDVETGQLRNKLLRTTAGNPENLK